MSLRENKKPDNYKPVRRPLKIRLKTPSPEGIMVSVKASTPFQEYPASFSSIRGKYVTELRFLLSLSDRLLLTRAPLYVHDSSILKRTTSHDKPLQTSTVLLRDREEMCRVLAEAMVDYRQNARDLSKSVSDRARMARRKWDRIRKSLHPLVQEDFRQTSMVLFNYRLFSISRISASISLFGGRSVADADRCPSEQQVDKWVEGYVVKNLASEHMSLVSSPEGDFFAIGGHAFVKMTGLDA